MDSTFIEHKHNNLMKYQTLIRTTATLYLLMAVLGCTDTKESKEGFLQVDKKVISVAKTATETRFTVFSTERWQLSKSNTGAEWITSIAADNGTSNAYSIIGENDAFITIMTTANPSSAGRSTRLTLRAIDQAGKALTYPTPVTISFTQVPTKHTGNVSVTTQAQVDALRTSLTAGATRIVGNVTIGPKEGTSDISDLSPLASIIEITGNVRVRRNPDLPNLMGLNQLQTIGGSFEVGGGYGAGNVTLTSLGDFSTLQSIGSGFVVESNHALTSLGDFTALQSIGGSFKVGNFVVEEGNEFSYGNATLTSLGDFSTLQSIGGSFEVRSNNTLISLGRFPMLASIGSADEVYVPNTVEACGGMVSGIEDDVSIVVEGNYRLQDCCVLTAFLSGAINAVSGEVFTGGNAPGCNTMQVNCDPFLQVDQKVVFVAKTATEYTLNLFSRQHWQLNTGAEWITNIAAGGDNSDASSITGENDAFITITTTANPNDEIRSTTLTLRAIDQAGKALTDLTPVTISFTQLGTAYVGDVTLHSQVDVNALALPPNATAIHGDLIIGSSSDITDLRPLSGIAHVTGRIEVVDNSSLVSLGPLGNLQTIGGSFVVKNNDALTSLRDFPTLQSIGGWFYVSSNNALTSLGDFTALQSIGDYFEVYNNDTLTSLGDFSTLESIGDGFVVKYNATLTSMGSFPMLASIGSSDGVYVRSIGTEEDGVSIMVEGNGRLQDCCVLTAFLSGATNAVSGKVFIGNNDPGCNSTTEVNDDSFLQVGKKVVFVAKTAGEDTLEIFSRGHWQLSKPNTGAEWITNIATGGGNSDASSITGENHAFITITTTANPNDAGRSTTLTLRTIDQAGNALTDLTPVTIPFTQLGTTHTGSIKLKSQSSVNALPANFTAIQGDLIIGDPYSNSDSDITDLRPLSGITHVTGRVEVVNNDRLVNLGSLGNLQSIGGSFWVSSNAVLTSLGGFTALQSIGGSFEVGGYGYGGGNASLTSLGDFPDLQSIGGKFEVSFNNALISLGDFPALQTIGGSFKVGNFAGEEGDEFSYGNAALTSLGDFPALQTIGGSFEVRSNNTLASLEGFPMLARIGSADRVFIPNSGDYYGSRVNGVSIVVIENDRLQDCCVLTTFLNGATNAVYGEVFINYNATGCSSEAEMKSCAGGSSSTKGK